MSTFRRIVNSLMSEVNDLKFGISTQAGGSVTLSLYTFTANEPATIYWGDGESSTTTGSGYVAANHTYVNATSRTSIRLVCGGRGLYRIKFAGDGIDLLDSNEKWGLHPVLDKLEMGTKTYTMNFHSLPPKGANLNYVYQNMTNALFPLSVLPESATSMAATFSGCAKAILPFTNLPPKLVTGTNIFSGCTSAISTITELPDTLTACGGIFNKCAKMDIRLSKFPPGITTLNSAFNQTNAVINLDEVVANAPEGGFTALTDIAAAFYYAPGVTGSRSRFLAICPNLTNTNNAFTGTNTTD